MAQGRRESETRTLNNQAQPGLSERGPDQFELDPTSNQEALHTTEIIAIHSEPEETANNEMDIDVWYDTVECDINWAAGHSYPDKGKDQDERDTDCWYEAFEVDIEDWPDFNCQIPADPQDRESTSPGSGTTSGGDSVSPSGRNTSAAALLPDRWWCSSLPTATSQKATGT